MSTPSDVTYLSKPVVMCSFASYFIVSSISHSFMIAYDSFHLLKSSKLNAGSSILKKLQIIIINILNYNKHGVLGFWGYLVADGSDRSLPSLLSP